VTCVTFPITNFKNLHSPFVRNQRDGVRLPGSILQGILARSALVLLRCYLGVIFLVAAAPKLQGDFTPRLTRFLETVALQQGHPLYQDFVRRMVLPNTALVASLITWGELWVGLSLLLGLTTRLSAALALLLLVNYMLAKGVWFWQPSSNDGPLAVIAVALLIGAAGRTFGLDALLARRWPRSPLW
jgi:thiosulfate dehydrogenase [quinone] large subunit